MEAPRHQARGTADDIDCAVLGWHAVTDDKECRTEEWLDGSQLPDPKDVAPPWAQVHMLISQRIEYR
jgi:hypothetical protein